MPNFVSSLALLCPGWRQNRIQRLDDSGDPDAAEALARCIVKDGRIGDGFLYARLRD